MSYQSKIRNPVRVSRMFAPMGSYQSKIRNPVRVPRMFAPTGDWWDDMRQKFANQQAQPSAECLASANAATQPLEARRDLLIKTWNPTGYYTPQNILDLVKYTLSMLAGAANTVQQVMADPESPGDRDALGQLLAEVQGKMQDSLDYTNAAKQALATNVEVIASAGIKRWIINSMTSAASAIAGAGYVACMRPWWVGALGAFMSTFETLYQAASATAGLALDIVKAAGKTILEIPDAIATAWTIAKYGALVGGAYYLAVKLGLIKHDVTGLIKG